jgi:murein DD-endopeptidase MepM/ murein hydrolase activator NlpD
MENHGYTVADPATAPDNITPRMREIREGPMTSGVLARMPSYTGEKLPPGTALPVFAQVEATFEPGPGPRSNWVRFAEYQRNRRERSQPPQVLLPEFAGWLKQFAADSGCESWLFRSGTLFGDPGEWWGDGNLRRTRHEGLDFAEGKQGGKTRSIPYGTPVRAMTEGDFIAVLDDFLGKTVVLLHPSIVRPDGTVFCTMYSHIQPEADLSRSVYRGQLLGRVAKSRTAGAPAHLHLTGAWIPKAMGPGEITLDRINPGYDPAVLVDFNSLLRKALQDSKSGIPD